MSKLYQAVLRIDNLYASWLKVRESARSSKSAETKSQLAEIEANPLKYIKSVQLKLAKGTYQFSEPRGIVKKKPGKKPRPLMIATLRDRIVQRAILNVLQEEKKQPILKLLGKIPQTLRTPTSIGGVPGRGVNDAILQAHRHILEGASHFIKSDIKSFFTHVRQSEFIAFISEQTGDEKFCALLKSALTTELANRDDPDIIEFSHIFPDGDKGVAQGSSLSALAANLVLSRFDAITNDGEVLTLRYIDDFIMLSGNSGKLDHKFQLALNELKRLGMEAHVPGDGTDKAARGITVKGFDFLGFNVSTSGLAPSRKSIKRLDEKFTDLVIAGKKSVVSMQSASERRSEVAYIQSLTKIDNMLRGWGDAYRICNRRLEMSRFDQRVGELLRNYRHWFSEQIRDATSEQIMRMQGVALLRDTPHLKVD